MAYGHYLFTKYLLENIYKQTINFTLSINNESQYYNCICTEIIKRKFKLLMYTGG